MDASRAISKPESGLHAAPSRCPLLSVTAKRRLNLAPRDYGQRTKRKSFSLGWTLFGVVLVAAAVGGLWWQRQVKSVAEYQHWVIQGPPCAPSSKAALEA